MRRLKYDTAGLRDTRDEKARPDSRQWRRGDGTATWVACKCEYTISPTGQRRAEATAPLSNTDDQDQLGSEVDGRSGDDLFSLRSKA